MAIIKTDDSHYKAIADTIRDKFESNETYLPENMAMGVQTACEYQYHQGFSMGEQIGYDSGVYNGKQEAYDEFWDKMQQNGVRDSYCYAFGEPWDDETFKPKYDMIPAYAERMFTCSNITNLKARLEECGVMLDLKKAFKNSNTTQMFMTSAITHVPVMDASEVNRPNGMRYTFQTAKKLISIEKLILPDDGETVFYETTFKDCRALTDITIEGVIGTTVTFQWCPLSRASIESIFAALSDTVTEQTATFNQAAVESAFSTDEWTALVASKPNWTISLV